MLDDQTSLLDGVVVAEAVGTVLIRERKGCLLFLENVKWKGSWQCEASIALCEASIVLFGWSVSRGHTSS